MKKLLFFLPVLLFSFKGTPPRKFVITIKQWAMISAGDMTVRVSNDSISATGRNYRNEEYGFDNGISSSQEKKLLTALAAINLDSLKEEYVDNNAADDKEEFDFIFEVNGKKTKTHVYLQRVNELLDLVKSVNELMPDDMQIVYDEKYLK
jgi:hypothetical protein